MLTLQNMLAGKPYDDLPPAWHDFNLSKFSETKELWNYQKEALEYAIKALWKYYQDFEDFVSGEPLNVNAKRKEKFWQWYRDNGLEENLDIPQDKQRRDVQRLLQEYYPAENGVIPYHHFINRMGFWMATGSGKSLILIKLIELLWHLMWRGEIPPNDILVLTVRDDLLAQLKTHVEEFNAGRTDFRIDLADLKAYPDIKRGFIPTIGQNGITVFFYRSDNLSTEQKERLVDFRNYDQDGRWYLLLDEAHKGDKEDSKRQHIYSILSRNGFLFNFSATFTDPRDILTTVYNFNLSEFVKAGYGKHIVILKQETRAFEDKEDYTGLEKQRVVLKALLMLAYVRRAAEDIDPGFYHRPLMLTLVHTVKTRDADLKLFFRELERIGQGNIDPKVWERAQKELWEELAEGPELLFEDGRISANKTLFDSITPLELLRLVYNAPAPGEIEVILRPSNSKEMAFKLKSAEQPFALIKIGNISGWLKDEFGGYEVIEGYEDEGFFQHLNDEDSPINILMGSRTFYEGWDSNRPNVITYINIGTGTEARKFILQSVGRGVRIEPLPGRRKRLQHLYNAGEVDGGTFLETLFIFGTNRKALQTVIRELDREKRREDEHELSLELNPEAAGKPLLIPVYREAEHLLIESREPRKFEISSDELEDLQTYVQYLGDERLLVSHHGADPSHIHLLQKCLNNPEQYFNHENGKRYGSFDILLSCLFAYFRVIPQEVEGLKPLEDEIRHFRHIRVYLKDISELQEKIKHVLEAPSRISELKAKYETHQLSFEEMLRQAQNIGETETFVWNNQVLHIKRVANHYYLPVLLSENEKIDYIRRIIRHPSEVRFLNVLEEYLSRPDNAFQKMEWWVFSRLDETLDEVYIPYYDPKSNRIRRFLPDFIFWLKKGTLYAVVFIDPKGMEHAGYQHKVDGFRELFEENGKPKIFRKNGWKISVHLLLYARDANQAPAEYRRFWFDHPKDIARCILENQEGFDE